MVAARAGRNTRGAPHGAAQATFAAVRGRHRSRRPMVVPLVLAATLLLAGCAAGGSGTSALNSLAASSATPSGTATAVQSAASTTGESASLPSRTSSSIPPPPPPPPPPAAVSAIPADGAQGVDPLAPISITVTAGTLDSVVLTNPDGVEIPGTIAPDGLSWMASAELGYGRTYTISAAARNVAGAVSQTESSFTTVVPNNKAAVRVYPSNGMTVGIAQPLSFVFDEPITDREAALRAITITTTPEQAGGFRWINDQEVRWRPAAFWQPYTTVAVAVDIYGRDLGDGVYGQQDVAVGFAIGRSMVADIDDNTKQMVVTQDGQVINTIPVSMGSNKYPTYNGIHVVAEKYEKKIMDSSTWGLTGTGAYRTEVSWATRISSSGEFVHAAPWSVNSQGVENVSHGCVNVSMDAAKWFYDTFIPGDPVIIKNTIGPALQVWDGFGDFQLPFEQYVA
jgi:lipoprotein-anchoring transpeptidase ErfK/SrfK